LENFMTDEDAIIPITDEEEYINMVPSGRT
jgi:hypothetical protein